MSCTPSMMIIKNNRKSFSETGDNVSPTGTTYPLLLNPIFGSFRRKLKIRSYLLSNFVLSVLEFNTSYRGI